jgi:hypothetical protein
MGRADNSYLQRHTGVNRTPLEPIRFHEKPARTAPQLGVYRAPDELEDRDPSIIRLRGAD